MASMGFMVAIFLRIFWIWIPVSANGEIFEMNITLTWDESLKYCESIGKVLLDIKESNSKMILMNRLNDGNQTWVASRIELSDFIKMPVCRATTGLKSNVSRTFDSNMISNCLKFCKNHRYIGLKERDCLCINEVNNLTPSKACSFTCNNDQSHLCGGNESFSLYEKVDTNITQQIAPGYKECVYAQKVDNTTELFTASCVGNTAEGGLCESENTSECKNHNWTSLGSHLCRMDIIGLFRWKQTKQFCAFIGGQLASPYQIPLNLEGNHTYWLGIHRVTTVHEDKEERLTKNYTYCSVARKEGGIVTIEAEYCQAKHTFICKDESLERSSASPQSTDKPFHGYDSECTDTNITYGMVAVSVMLLVALVITALVCDVRRRQVLQESVKESTTRSTREQHVLLERLITNPPSQPSRHIHTENENSDSSYLTVIFDRGRQDVAMEQPGCSQFD